MKPHMTSAHRFRALAAVLQAQETCTMLDVAREAVARGWLSTMPTGATLAAWRREWQDEGVVDYLERENGTRQRICWSPEYEVFWGLMRQYLGRRWQGATTAGIRQWRLAQMLGLIIHRGHASNESMRMAMLRVGDPTAVEVGKNWDNIWKEVVRLARRHDRIKLVRHAEERVRYYLIDDEIPPHEMSVADHMLHLIREQPRTLAELQREMNASRKVEVRYNVLSSTRANLYMDGLCHTGAKGNRYQSSPIYPGPDPERMPHVRAAEPEPKPAKKPRTKVGHVRERDRMRDRVWGYNHDPHWSEVYSASLATMTPEEQKAVRRMAGRCRDFRMGVSNRGGLHKQSPTDAPVAELFRHQRNDIRETHLSAVALWLSWQDDRTRATS